MKKKSNAEVKVRLNKYISQSGLCSRREADNLIKQGHVKVNGSLCNELGSKVNINDLVQINNKPIKPEKNIYILLNKPKDYITSNKDTQNKLSINGYNALKKNFCDKKILDQWTKLL